MKLLKIFFPLFIFLSGCDEGIDPLKNYHPPVADSIISPKDRRNQILDSISNNEQMVMLNALVGHCDNPKGAPSRDSVVWKPHYGNLTTVENSFAGTWTAEMVDAAITAGGKMLLGDSTSDKKGQEKLIDAVEKNRTAEQGCEWLEFYPDHTGFWNSCMMEKGEPTALDNVDVYSGKHEGSGVKFEWYADAKTIHIKFEDCMKFPLTVKNEKDAAKNGNFIVRVRYWDLQLVKKRNVMDGMETWTVRDYLPEYKYTSTAKFVYSHSAVNLLKKVDDYKSAITD